MSKNLKRHLSFLFMVILKSNFIFSQQIETKLELSNLNNPYFKYSHYEAQLKVSHQNWKLIINPEVVDSYVGKKVLGTNFSREKFMGRFCKSVLSYDKDNFNFQIGRSPIKWGQSYEQSIIQSGYAPSYDHLIFELSLNNLSAKFLAGQLGSQKIGSERILRLISGRRFSGAFLNKKLNISLGEQIIYTGKNRSHELFYLNPAIPYVFAAYEDNDLDVDSLNNDNSMIFIDANYNIKGKHLIYFEFIIDDFQIYDDPVQDMLGVKIGVRSHFRILNRIVNWEVELTEIDTWTYIHSGRGQFTSWQNLDHPIGHPYGSDLKSLKILSEIWLKKESIFFKAEYNRLVKGSVGLNDMWGNINSLSNSFPSSPEKTLTLIQTTIGFQLKNFSLETGYSNIPLSYDIANNLVKELSGGFFIDLKISSRFDFNLN